MHLINGMKHAKEFSESVDEYLEEMYRCEQEGGGITTKGLSERLKISMPSVSEMLPKLREKGFIEYERRGEARLTQKGRRAGALVYSKFEILRKFLVGLGFGEMEAKEEACRLEHAVSARVAAKLRNCK